MGENFRGHTPTHAKFFYLENFRLYGSTERLAEDKANFNRLMVLNFSYILEDIPPIDVVHVPVAAPPSRIFSTLPPLSCALARAPSLSFE